MSVGGYHSCSWNVLVYPPLPEGQSVKVMRSEIEQLARQGAKALVMRSVSTITLKDSSATRVREIVDEIVYWMKRMNKARFCCAFVAAVVEIEKIKRKVALAFATLKKIEGGEATKMGCAEVQVEVENQ